MALKQIISEKSGNLSCTRVMMVVVTLFVLGWCTRIVWANPYAMPDIPENWAMFLFGLYGINKIATKVIGLLGKKPEVEKISLPDEGRAS